MTPEELLIVLQESEAKKKKAGSYPFFTRKMELIVKYDKDELKKCLKALYKQGKIKVGRTLNDYYYKTI